jgi:hypothetical protein
LISFTRADIPLIPEDVAFAIAPCAGRELTDTGLRGDIAHSLFSHLATRMGFGDADITVEKEISGRPVVIAGVERWGASITHTRGMIACAVNRQGEIGLDLERTDRSEHPALRKRMLSSGDDPDLLDRCSTIQLWTIKESVLKLYGSGLRVPMKTVALMPVVDVRNDSALKNNPVVNRTCTDGDEGIGRDDSSDAVRPGKTEDRKVAESAAGNPGQVRNAVTDALVRAHVNDLFAMVCSGRIDAFRFALAWWIP